MTKSRIAKHAMQIMLLKCVIYKYDNMNKYYLKFKFIVKDIEYYFKENKSNYILFILDF